LPYILIAVLAIVLLILKLSGCDFNQSRTRKTDPSGVNRNRGFDRRTSFLEYSNHAQCRMNCRHITQQEVQDIMVNGRINYSKSDIKNARCPRYALEGKTSD